MAGAPSLLRSGSRLRPTAAHAAIVVSPLSITLAWQEDVGSERRIAMTHSAVETLKFAPPVLLPTSAPADEWKPALAWNWGSIAGWQWPRIYLAFVQTTNGNERIQVASTWDRRRNWQITPADPDPPLYPAP
jgi:hypothetical protein